MSPKTTGPETAVHYRTILAATDFSELAAAAIEAAIGIGRRAEAERVHLVHIATTPDKRWSWLGLDAKRGQEIASQELQTSREQLQKLELDAGGLTITREVRPGMPARQLAELAGEISADLIVVASRGHSGLKRIRLGSVSNALIRIAPCPVLVVGGNRRTTGDFTTVIVGVDFSAMARVVFAHAVAMARMSGGLVRALSAYEAAAFGIPENKVLPHRLTNAELAQIEHKHREGLTKVREDVDTRGVRVSMEVTMRDSASDAILERAQKDEAPLIVMGTSGHNAVQRAILGSTATRVVAEAPCPVLVVPYDDAGPQA